MTEKELIGAPAKRYEELAHKEFEWHSFYNGWLEGRAALLKELSDKKPGKEEKATARKFKRPSLEEVVNYCIERANNIDAQQFIDHYNSNGWKVGRNAMKDWKAAVRTWEKKENEKRKYRPSSGIDPHAGSRSATARIAEHLARGIAGNSKEGNLFT